MALTYNRCPLCDSENISDFLKARDHLLTSEVFPVYKCASCGFVFTQGTPSVNEIGRYYQSQDYVSHSDNKKGLMNKIYHLGRSLMLRKKYGMVNKVTLGKRLLDIGSGTGYFPAHLKLKGFDVTGVEVDENARGFSKKEFGLTVFSPEEFLKKGLQKHFDVITLWHVLEHLDDFNLYLDEILDHLAPGGSLIIALPNLSAFDARHYKEYWAGYDVPRHLWHFTPATFEILAEKHGLKINKMKRLPLDPFYNAMLSEKYRGNKLYMISGVIIGMWAYIESLFDIRKSSSVVYFLKRKDNPHPIV